MSEERDDNESRPTHSWAHFFEWAGSGHWSYHVFDLWVGCACAVILVILSQLGLFGGPQLGWGIAAFAILVTTCTTWIAYLVFTRRK